MFCVYCIIICNTYNVVKFNLSLHRASLMQFHMHSWTVCGGGKTFTILLAPFQNLFFKVSQPHSHSLIILTCCDKAEKPTSLMI